MIKMKKEMIIGVLGMVLVSLASAGLVDFLSNKVSGSVEVEGPIWFLDNQEGLMGDDSWSLKLNDDSSSGVLFTLEDGDDLAREFFSESLGVDGFYPVQFDVILDSKVEAGTDFCSNACNKGKIPICLNEGAEDCYHDSEIDCVDYCNNEGEADLIDNLDLYGQIGVSVYLVDEYGDEVDEICSLSGSDVKIYERESEGYSFVCIDEDDVLGSLDEGDRLKLVMRDASWVGIRTKTYIGGSYFQMEVRK
jgi:hypothetical protein